jgi:hypothetical protein
MMEFDNHQQSKEHLKRVVTIQTFSNGERSYSN